MSQATEHKQDERDRRFFIHMLRAVRGRRALVVVAVLLAMIMAFLVSDGFFGERYEGKTLRTWSRQLFSANPQEQAAARAALVRLGPTAIPELERLVRSRDSFLRNGLRSIASHCPRPLERFILFRLGPSDTSIKRITGAQILAEMGPRAAEAVPALAAMMNDPHPEVVGTAAAALGRIGAPSVRHLILFAGSTNTTRRHMAVFALGEIGPPAAAAAPVLVERLGDVNPEVRSSAAYSLWRLGAAGRPSLLQVAAAEDLARAKPALFAITNSLSRSVLPELVDMAEGGTPQEKALAIKVLKRLNLQNPRIRALTGSGKK